MRRIDLVARKDVQPDIVIVDYNLPRGLNGLQVMARLREMLGHDVPALVLTGDISTETLSEIARQGYIHRSKPIRAEDLTRLIRAFLDGNHSASPKWVRPYRQPRPAARILRPFSSSMTTAPCATPCVSSSSRHGRPVEVYGSAQEFLDAHRSGRNACLVVDCRMPGMDGIELLERLKADGHQLPTIMITGYGDVPLAVRAMNAGAAGFIEKPVRGDELLAAIDRALEQAHGSTELADLRDAAATRIAALHATST